MGRHDIFMRTAPRPSRVRFAVSRAAAITLVLAVIAWVGASILFAPPDDSEQITSVQAGPPPSPAPADESGSAPTAEATGKVTLTVHVVGAVVRPGVYELKPGARVNDAIKAAGGMQEDARPDLLNLASPVTDGQQILLPDSAERGSAPPAAASPTSGRATGESQELVNINQADAETLDRLPGIGPALAGRIIEFRETNGPFTAVEELDEVSGIGPVLLKRLAELVRVS